jgi:hypothetical protein
VIVVAEEIMVEESPHSEHLAPGATTHPVEQRLEAEGRAGYRDEATYSGNRLVAAAEVRERIRDLSSELHATGLRASRFVVRAERLIEFFHEEHAVRVDVVAAGLERVVSTTRAELTGELRAHVAALAGVEQLAASDRSRLVLLASASSAVERELHARLDALAAAEPELFSSLSSEEFAGRLDRAGAVVEQMKGARQAISSCSDVANSARDSAEAVLRRFAPPAAETAVPVAPAVGGLSEREAVEVMTELRELEQQASDALSEARAAEATGREAVETVTEVLSAPADTAAKPVKASNSRRS